MTHHPLDPDPLGTEYELSDKPLGNPVTFAAPFPPNHDPATVEAVSARMSDYLRGPGRCLMCGVLRSGPSGQHETRMDYCRAHGEIIMLREKGGRVL